MLHYRNREQSGNENTPSINVLIMNTGDETGEQPSSFLNDAFQLEVTPAFHQVLKRQPYQLAGDEDNTYLFGPNYPFDEYELVGSREAFYSMIVDEELATSSGFNWLFAERRGDMDGTLWIGNTSSESGDQYNIYIHRDDNGNIDSLILDTGYLERQEEESDED